MSDLHLGSAGSKAEEASYFLKHHPAEQLILNGDIIDGWQLKKYGTWKKKHTAFFRIMLKQMKHYNTNVTYVRGNHDDFLDQVVPLIVGKQFKIVRDLIIQSGQNQVFITHGDVFDNVTTHMKWMAHLGDYGYTFLLWLNKSYNKYRKYRGLPYYSLSQVIKQKVKAALNYISDFEEKLVELAKSKDCQVIICGHIHKPDIKEINDVLYMNSGDWVESMSALVEDFDGKWHLKYFEDEYYPKKQEKGVEVQ